MPIIRVRTDPIEREALLAAGSPYFRTRSGSDRLGVWLGDHTDWGEIRELITDSYRILATKKLSALID